ncbi:MAG: galactokinase [Limnochordales bacterium]|nr:galactokinase [Bacillota bacterium]
MTVDEERLRTLLDTFHARYPFDPAAHPQDAVILVRSPGRVNLIGEHTDYNDGFVMPLAIDRDILLAGRRRRDDVVRVYSLNMAAEAVFRLSDLCAPSPTPSPAPSPPAAASAAQSELAPTRSEGAAAPPAAGSWHRYVAGVLWALREAGCELGGFDATLAGNIPVGAGLSSSAALEVGIAVLVQELFELAVDRATIAKLCQRAENEYVGVQCGIMDQFAVALGRDGYALLLDCRTLDCRYVPLPARHVRLVVADTGVRRALASSEYNTRRSQCEQGVALLRQHLPGIRALRDVSPEAFAALRDRLPGVIARRCSHVISENARVQATAQALANDNFEACGQLMYASHASLRDDYEVSCRELDEMVDIARSVPGVYGARMTGAGFGGCIVSLVRAEAVDALVAAIEAEYPKRTGKTPAVYVVAPSGGAARIL